MKTLGQSFFILLLAQLSVEALAQPRLLVVNKDSDSLSVLDAEQGKTIKVINTGKGPHEVVVTADNKRAVVSDYGYGCNPSRAGRSLTVVDLQSYQTQTIELGQFRSPHGIAAFKDGRHVAVTVECDQAVLVVDVIEGKIVKSIDTKASGSHMVVLSPDQKMAFTTNLSDDSVSVLDLVDGKNIKVIQAGNGTEGIDITPDGKQVWVTNRGENTISVIDVDSLKITNTFDVGQTPIRLKFNQKNNRALVSNATSATVEQIDLDYNILSATAMNDLPVKTSGQPFRSGAVPIGILVHPDGDKAYIANTNVHAVKVIDLKSNQVIQTFKAEQRPDGLAWVK